MHEDIVEMVKKMDRQIEITDQLSREVTQVLDRGNRPSILMTDRWSAHASEVVRLVDEMRELSDRLMANVGQLSDDDIRMLQESQSRFKISQDKHGEVVRRTKKALGLIP